MKLGALTVQIEVEREPCKCGQAPTKANIEVRIGMIPTGITSVTSDGLRCDMHLAIDTAQVERDAVQALACRGCEA